MIASDPAVWFVSALAGSLITISLSVLVGDWLREVLSGFAFKLYRQPRQGIQGLWTAVFDDESNPDDPRYPVTERIELRTFLGLVVGRRLDPPSSQNAAKKLFGLFQSPPIRLKGHFIDNRYLVGTWTHPSPDSRAVGAFQLVLREDGKSMDGVWIKYRERDHRIVNGTWSWNWEEIE